MSFTATSVYSCNSKNCKFAVYSFASIGLCVLLTEKLPGLDKYSIFILFEYRFAREEVFTFRELHVTPNRGHDRLKSLFSPHSFWLNTHLTVRCMICVIDTVPLKYAYNHSLMRSQRGAFTSHEFMACHNYFAFFIHRVDY
jgi:hypothetical protein